jgi:hypothetical protein
MRHQLLASRTGAKIPQETWVPHDAAGVDEAGNYPQSLAAVGVGGFD